MSLSCCNVFPFHLPVNIYIKVSPMFIRIRNKVTVLSIQVPVLHKVFNIVSLMSGTLKLKTMDP